MLYYSKCLSAETCFPESSKKVKKMFCPIILNLNKVESHTGIRYHYLEKKTYVFYEKVLVLSFMMIY